MPVVGRTSFVYNSGMTTGRQEVRVALCTHSRDELMSSLETAGEGAIHKSNKTNIFQVPQNVTLNAQRIGGKLFEPSASGCIAYLDRIKILIKHKNTLKVS